MLSIVDKSRYHFGPVGKLCIRARVREDLERLRDSYLPALGPILPNAGSDYPFRAYASRKKVADAMVRAVIDIGYDGVKEETKRLLGPEREPFMHALAQVSRMLEPAGWQSSPEVAYSDSDRWG
jgi:hypothetical protein